MAYKIIKAIINIIIFFIIAIPFLVFREKTEFLLDNKFDFLVNIFILMIYLVITSPINCFLDIKIKKRFKNVRR